MTNPNFFNIDDPSQGISRQLTDEISARVFPGEQGMLSLVRIAANAIGNIHSHSEEQWGMCLEGSGIRIQDGVDVPFAKGDFWCTLGGVEHGVRAGPDGAMIVDFFCTTARGVQENRFGLR